jgi:hypothetical protein
MRPEREGVGRPLNPWFLAELACWTMVGLAPILNLVDGPSVSSDQFVVRTVVLALAMTGGVCLRIRKILIYVHGRRK